MPTCRRQGGREIWDSAVDMFHSCCGFRVPSDGLLPVLYCQFWVQKLCPFINGRFWFRPVGTITEHSYRAFKMRILFHWARPHKGLWRGVLIVRRSRKPSENAGLVNRCYFWTDITILSLPAPDEPPQPCPGSGYRRTGNAGVGRPGFPGAIRCGPGRGKTA